MNDNRSRLLSDLPHRLRERVADLQSDLRRWRADLREDPSLLWRTTAVRVLLWLTVGVCALVGVWYLTTGLLPAGERGEPEQATHLATLYVACTNPFCYTSYITRQPMDFDGWPLACRECGQRTVYRAKLCPTCHRWYATVPGAPNQCPFCAVPQTDEPERPEPLPSDPDDAEDPW